MEQNKRTVSVDLTIDEARQIAFEALRAVTMTPGWEDTKDLIGRELDITDEIMDRAVGLLFSDKNNIEMEEKKYYILGKVHHQDDTSPIELLGDTKTIPEMSKIVSNMMNSGFPPKNIFVVEGVKKDIAIKQVSIT